MPKWDSKRGKKKGKRKKIQHNTEDTCKESTTQESKDAACHWSDGQMHTDPNKLSEFQIKFEMDYNTKRWWFLSSSNLQHNDHPPVQIETQLGGEHDMSAKQMKFITQLYQHIVAPSTISAIMT